MPNETQAWEQVCGDAAAARARAVKALARLGTLGDDETIDAISAATALRAEVEKWRAALEGAGDKAVATLAMLDRRADEQLESLTDRLRAELSRRGCAVHGEGDTIVVSGVVQFVLNRDSRTATLNDVRLEDLGHDRIANHIHDQIETLRKGMTPPPAMLQALREAYDLELRDSGKPAGVQVETESLMMRMALLRQTRAFRSDPVRERFLSYPRAQFRADLFWLLESRELESAGRRLRHAAGSSTSGALFMLVPDLGHPAYVGRVWFEEVEASQ